MKTDEKTRVVIGVSGAGRSLKNLLEREAREGYRICGVIASRADCGGCEIAMEYGLPLFVDSFKRKELPVTAVAVEAFLRSVKADYVALAGFLKPFPLANEWRGRVVNIHPALLPKFGGEGMYGERVHSAVLAAGEATSGATVHFVTEEYDAGAVIGQVRVPVLATDSPESLAARVFAAECDLYPKILSGLAKN